MKQLRLLPLTLIFLLLLFSSLSSSAQPDERMGVKYYNDAVRYYKSGDYDSAIQNFLRAYELDRKAVLLYNIGKCHQMKKNCSRALDYFTKYIEATKNSPDPAVFTKAQNAISECRKTIPGEIAVDTNPPGAKVLIDGQFKDITPCKIQLKYGTYKMELTKLGFITKVMTLTLTETSSRAYSFTLAKSKERLLAECPEGTFEKGGNCFKKVPLFKTYWAILTASIGVAGIAVLIVAILKGKEAKDQETEANDLLNQKQAADRDKYNSLMDSAEKNAQIATVLYIVGPALIATSVLVTFLPKVDKKVKRDTAARYLIPSTFAYDPNGGFHLGWKINF